MKNFLFKSTVALTVLFLSGKLSAQISTEVRDVLTSAIVTEQTLYFWVDTGTTHTYELDAYNISNASHTYRIEKQEFLMNATASAWFCVFHNGDPADLQSHCYGNQTGLAPDNFVTAAGDYNMLQCDFSTHTIGLSIVRYRIYDQNNPTDSAGFNLVYYATPAGVQSYERADGIGQAFPNPSAGLFHFSLDVNAGSEPVMLGVYNLNGELVRSQQVNVSNGQIETDLSDLANGVYFCRFSSGDLIFRERRIVIAK